MTAIDSTTPHGSGRRAGRRGWVPFAAAATAAALTFAAIATAGGGTAGAATAPNAQSAGNFLDATIGGNPIDNIAKLAFARAQNPGSTTDQNPLDVTVLNAINLPLTGALQLPKLAGINLGAVNQVAFAKSSGASYGAAGAVLNSGGVSVGGDNSAPPAGASIDLCASALNGGQCGSGPADALGEIKLQINGVSSIARTPEFGPALGAGWPSTCTQASPTCYDIASIDLLLDSPALGSLLSGLLKTLSTTLGSLVTTLTNAVGGLPGGTAALASCVLTSPTVITQPISLDNGAVVLDPTNASLKISLDALLKTLGLDLNALPANTDLLAKVLDYLTSPDGLAKGLEGVINGITDVLVNQFNGCKDAISAIPAIGPLLVTLITALTNGQTTLETAINGLVDKLAGSAGANPLLPLANALKPLLDIGINVQPQVSSGDFTSAFDTNPKQGMTPPPVPYQHTVRAIEVKLLGNSGVNLALANSAAGPSNPTSPTTPPTTAPPTSVPTGVPAGLAAHGGSPLLPAILLSLGLIFAAGGVVSYRMRGALNKH